MFSESAHYANFHRVCHAGEECLEKTFDFTHGTMKKCVMSRLIKLETILYSFNSFLRIKGRTRLAVNTWRAVDEKGIETARIRFAALT